MNLTKSEKEQILRILQTPHWQAAERLANLMRDDIAYQTTARDTEWDTLKAVLINEGKIQGIKLFIDELYKQAKNE